MTAREAATWLGVPDDEDLESLLQVPPFRRAISFVIAGNHTRVWRDRAYPSRVLERFHFPTTRNGDIDLAWLRDVAITIGQ